MSPTGEIKKLLDNSLKSEIESTYIRKIKKRHTIASMNAFSIEPIYKTLSKPGVSDQKTHTNNDEGFLHDVVKYTVLAAGAGVLFLQAC